MKKLLLTTLCIAGLSACTTLTPVTSTSPLPTIPPVNQVEGDTVYLSDKRPAYEDPKFDREKYYTYLVGLIKSKYPEEDARSADQQRQHYFLASPMNPMIPNNPFTRPEQAPRFTPPGLDQQSYTMARKACPNVKFLEGDGGDVIYGEMHGRYLHELSAYMERWNRTMLMYCRT